MLPLIKRYRSEFYSGLVGLFFILLLYVKPSYTAIPLIIAASGLVLLIQSLRQGRGELAQSEKWLLIAIGSYFLVFVISFLIHDGKLRELDTPSKVLLLLSTLALYAKIRLKINWILSAVLLAAATAGVVATYRFFLLDTPYMALFPTHMYIQAGDMAMSLGMFSIAIAFYFYRKKSKIGVLCAFLAAGLAILASLVNQARGAWVATPVILLIILLLNRKLLSKWFLISLALIASIGALLAGELIKERWQQAYNEVAGYFTQNIGATSVGGRLDMWKSSFIGIQEKPILGRGVEAIPEMRQNHFKQGLISEYASNFQNAHNQYLHDATARGLVGLAALLAVFFVPLWQFWRNLKGSEVGSQAHLWGVLGITHVLATMGYCLTQSFLSHNSGTMFYFFTVFLLLGLQKSAQNRPLAEAG